MFNIRLKELRTERGITQKKLAEHLGYNQSMIVRWEKGECQPTEEAIRRTATYFKVTADYLIGLEDETGAKTYSAKYHIGTLNNSGKIDMK